jgi:hypothetical protein
MNQYKQAWLNDSLQTMPDKFKKIHSKNESFNSKLGMTVDVLEDASIIASMDGWLPFADVIAIGYAAYNIYDIWD